MRKNYWNPTDYVTKHSFVYEYGNDLISLLKPKKTDVILDLGCGTGNFTQYISQYVSKIIGIDSSLEMLEKAKEQFQDIPFINKDATNLGYFEKFDAVVSNAVLHWINEKEQLTVAKNVLNALIPGGRFVAEFGGFRNCDKIFKAFERALVKCGIEKSGEFYFPTISQYGAILENAGFDFKYAALFERKTKLSDAQNGLANWLKMFTLPQYQYLSDNIKESLIRETENSLKETELFIDNEWYADYVRIRICAYKPKGAAE